MSLKESLIDVIKSFPNADDEVRTPKNGISFKANSMDRRFVKIEPQAKSIRVKLNLNSASIDDPMGVCKPIGKSGWDYQCLVRSESDIEIIKPLIEQAYYHNIR